MGKEPLHTSETLTDAQLNAILNRLDRFARLNDSQFRIPFTKWRIGIDALIGFIPVIGETIGLLLSLYLLVEAFKLKMPARLKLRMLANILLDWLIGLIPVLGDFADIAFKANVRNMQLLHRYIAQEQQRRQPVQINRHSMFKVLSLLGLGILIIVFSYYVLAHYL